MDKNKKLKSASKGDASPLTTSTESESFDTWTVISGKAQNNSSDTLRFTPLTPEKSDDDDDAVRVEVFKAPKDLNENRYNDIDDLSDGISIISESESAGRLSPHPELRKHLSELNMRFINPTETPLSSTEEAKQPPLSYEASSERSSDDFHRVESLVENNRKTQRTSMQIVDSTSLQSTCRCGLRGLFYVGALLAVLAFFSKLKYNTWESVLGTTTDVLTQKISDLELKNNLMRAEIDILSKQVNYLTTLSEAQKYSQNKPSKPQPRDNKFKAWPGNGNTIEQVEISQEDLKKPFKCEGSTNFDIAGICIELPMTAEEVADAIGEKVQTVIDDSDIFVNFETVADRVAKLVDNPFGEPVPDSNVGVPPKRADPIVSQEPTDSYTPHEHKPDKKFEKRENYKKHSNTKNNNNNSGESKENIKPRRDRSSEHSSKESGERYKKSKDYKKYDKRSASEYENAKREADGQWHEKMMQHRETTRKYNEKHRHDKNNWYIERGDSREQARVTEQKYHPTGQ